MKVDEMDSFQEAATRVFRVQSATVVGIHSTTAEG